MSQWPCGLRRGSAAARLLRLWVRIPSGSMQCECCVLSGTGLCDRLITRPEESHRVSSVCVLSRSFDNEEELTHWGAIASWGKRNLILKILIYLLTAIGLSPGGISTVHIYTQTVHRTTQNKQYIEQHNNLEECGPCPVLASYNLAFDLQLRKSTENFSQGSRV